MHKFFLVNPSLTKCSKGFVHIYGDNNNSRLTNCTFYSESGDIIALMVGLETTPTTFDTLRKALNAGGETKPPPMFKEEWLPTGGTPFAFKNPYLHQSLNAEMQKALATPSRAEPIYFHKLEESICLGILKSLVEMGFKKFETAGKPFGAKDVISALKLREEQHSELLMRRLLEILVEDKWLTFEANDNKKNRFKVATDKKIPSLEELGTNISNNLDFCGSNLSKEWEFSVKFLSEMTNILLGKTSALKLLFPEHDKTFSAER